MTLPQTPSQAIGPFFAVRLCWPDGPDEGSANATDPVLASIPDPAARARLVAVADGDRLRFDIWLQGAQETPFLAI